VVVLELLELDAAFTLLLVAANDGVAKTNPRMVAAEAATTAPRLILFLSISESFRRGTLRTYFGRSVYPLEIQAVVQNLAGDAQISVVLCERPKNGM
jgi:hypothetical protein